MSLYDCKYYFFNLIFDLQGSGVNRGDRFRQDDDCTINRVQYDEFQMNRSDSMKEVHYDREEFVDMCKYYELKSVSTILMLPINLETPSY